MPYAGGVIDDSICTKAPGPRLVLSSGVSSGVPSAPLSQIHLTQIHAVSEWVPRAATPASHDLGGNAGSVDSEQCPGESLMLAQPGSEQGH